MELSKTKTTLFSSLSQKKMREKYRLFIVEGEKSVFEIIESFPIESLLVTRDWINQNPEKYAEYKDFIIIANKEQIKKISSLKTPPEVVGIYHFPEEKEIIINEKDLYLVLDGIQDPGNLGTIIRTADWFGINVIFASKDTADIFNPKVVQATMGSLARVRIVYTDIKKLFEENSIIPVYGTLLNGENIYESGIYEGTGFLIMGNEGQGISDELIPFISHKIKIPPYKEGKHAESLNVGVACGIVLSCFRNKFHCHG